MSQPNLKIETNQLSVDQTFDASIERLFAYFTEPELLTQWHAPSDTMTVPIAEVDLRVNGNFRITMRNADGEEFTARGSYKEIEAPTKLVYTWGWDHTDSPETLVTVSFKAQGEKTEVNLTHTGFLEAEFTERHSEGWMGIFVRLAKHL